MDVISELQQQLEQVTAESERLKEEIAHVQRPPEDSVLSAGLSPEARLEVERQQQEWLQIQKRAEWEHARRKAELVHLRVRAYQLQQQLELESSARRMEAAQFLAKIASLERRLSAALEELSNGRNSLRA